MSYQNTLKNKLIKMRNGVLKLFYIVLIFSMRMKVDLSMNHDVTDIKAYTWF